MYSLSVTNAWIFAAPILAVGVFVQILSPETAKRMASLNGYSRREKTITILASVLPYPLFIYLAFVRVPFTHAIHYVGLALYSTAFIAFCMAVHDFLKGGKGLKTAGIYAVSRNPIYVTSSLLFVSILLMTYDTFVLLLLIAIFISQHFMILAEERACSREYGETYDAYRCNTSRYIFF